MTNGKASRSAVSISCEFIRNAPSPVATRTRESGLAIFAPIAPGTVQAIVDRPLEIRQVFGSYVGYRRAIHIFSAPVSTSTMSSRRSAARVSATIRAGASGNRSSPWPRASSLASGARPGRIGEGVEAVPDLGVRPDSDVVVRIDLGGEPVQMDDLGVAARVDPDRVELLQLIPDGDDQVRAVEAEVGIVVAHEPHRAQGQRVIVREHALAVERSSDRDAERLSETAHGLARARPRCPVPG